MAAQADDGGTGRGYTRAHRDGDTGQPRAGDWTQKDMQRLQDLVDHAHALGLWIRFYTLNGHDHAEEASQGWEAGYNFGSREKVLIRWRAAIQAGVDFVATDQYEAFAEVKR